MATVSQCKYHQPVGIGDGWELFCLSIPPRPFPLPDLTGLSPHTSPLLTLSTNVLGLCLHTDDVSCRALVLEVY